jgi:hypothetical protein
MTSAIPGALLWDERVCNAAADEDAKTRTKTSVKYFVLHFYLRN